MPEELPDGMVRRFYFPPPATPATDTFGNAEELAKYLATGADLGPLRGFINALLKTLQGDLGAMPAWIAEQSEDWLDDFSDWFLGLGANWDDLMSVFEGDYTGDNIALLAIQSTISTIKNLAGGLIDLSRLPSVPLGSLTLTQPNLLLNPEFDGAISMDGEGVWFWDESAGRTSPGAARTTGDGTRKVLTSNSVQAGPDEDFETGVWVRWDSVTGTGELYRLVISAYQGDLKLSDTVIGAITSPAANSSGWVEISGEYTTPANTDHVRLYLECTTNATGGQVWFDDAELRKTASSLPMEWIKDLLPQLSGLWDNLEALVNNALSALGIIGSGSLLDRILDLADEFGDMLGGIEDGAANFTNLLDQLLHDPASLLGTLPQSLVDGLTSGLNQIRDQILAVIKNVIQGIRGVPFVGDNIADALLAMLDEMELFRETTEENHQNLNNMVWEGATQQSTDVDRTEQQVRDAVSALKARSDTLRSENELRYGSSVPIWQGLVPGGDVTCSVDNLNLNEWITLTDSSGDTDAIFQPIAQVNQGDVAVAVFRARSTVQRDFVTFIAKTVATGMTDFRVGLWTYRYDEDKWEMVARSGNIATEISTTVDWVDAPLETSYSPEVGELMAVTWYCNGGQVHLASSRTIQVDEPLPTYHSVPYGTNATLFSNTNYTPGTKVAMTKETAVWQLGGTPFAQIAPNLGQEVELPPQYWFDDFNSYKSGYNGLGWPSDGKFQFQGTTDGSQSLYITSQMSTDRMKVEATASRTTVVDCGMAIHCDANGSYGVRVAVSSSEVRVYTADWGGTFTQRASVGNTSGAARWSVEFIPSTSTYVVQRNGTTVVSWPDTGNLASRGKGRRSAGLRVSRSTFINSPSWDDFLVFDVTDSI